MTSRWRRSEANIICDSEVLRMLRQRDRPTQEMIWRALRGRLKAVALSILNSADEADSLVADLFCDFFYDYVDDIREGQAIPAYLRVMAVRRARRRMSREHRQVPLEPEIALEDRSPETGSSTDRRIWSQWLHQCLLGLGEKARRVLKLHYGHDLSYEGVAGQLGGSKQAVGKMVLRSLGVLKKCLERRRIEAARR